ncbi:MAG: hypothetical protein ACREDR_01720 [Blastocatellia bacterium]
MTISKDLILAQAGPLAGLAGDDANQLIAFLFKWKQVIENTASAGDVTLMHSLLLHAGAPAARLAMEPRFLLNQDSHINSLTPLSAGLFDRF